ncbi:MAG: hypothetical protein HQL56_05680 [Magnetococcales bacterium]|nr:hypothetical protein [Magnetococcales bacterium]
MSSMSNKNNAVESGPVRAVGEFKVNKAGMRDMAAVKKRTAEGEAWVQRFRESLEVKQETLFHPFTI